MNPTFKQVQPLPALTPAMLAGEYSPPTFRPTRPTPAPVDTRAATPPAPARQLPRPRADQYPGKQALFAVLALSAVCCVGQALATMIGWSLSAPQLAAWVAQLLG